MKLSAEEWAEIDRIKAKKLGSECDTFEDLNYCLTLLDKLPKTPMFSSSLERFYFSIVGKCLECVDRHPKIFACFCDFIDFHTYT
jgi:hypothetical protein